MLSEESLLLSEDSLLHRAWMGIVLYVGLEASRLYCVGLEASRLYCVGLEASRL